MYDPYAYGKYIMRKTYETYLSITKKPTKGWTKGGGEKDAHIHTHYFYETLNTKHMYTHTHTQNIKEIKYIKNKKWKNNQKNYICILFEAIMLICVWWERVSERRWELRRRNTNKCEVNVRWRDNWRVTNLPWQLSRLFMFWSELQQIKRMYLKYTKNKVGK